MVGRRLLMFLFILPSCFISSASLAFDLVPGQAIVILTPSAMPTEGQITVSPPTFAISALDDILAQHGVYAIVKHVASYGGELVAEATATGDQRAIDAASRLERTFIVYYSGIASPEVVSAQLEALPQVELAKGNEVLEEAYGGTVKVFPDDLLGSQWNFHDTADDRSDIDAPEAWGVERGDTNVVIVVIDTGTLVNRVASNYVLHSDLRYRWNDPEDTSPKRTHSDNDLNGDALGDSDTYADNVIGFNYDRGEGIGITKPPFWTSVPHNYLLDLTSEEHWDLGGFMRHGLHVAGIALATANEENLVGMAHGCSGYFIRRGHDNITEAAAVEHACTVHPGSIVNMSIGVSTSGEPPGLPYSDWIIIAAIIRDCVLVACAGNEINACPPHNSDPDPVWYPAAFPDVISVGNMDRSVQHYCSSNYGEIGDVDIVAPVGVGIPSLSHSFCTPVPCQVNEEVMTTFGGTSAAAPQVAGVAALVRSRFPSLDQAQVRARLGKSAEWYWSDPPNPDDQKKLGSGKINAYRALTEWGKIDANTTWSANSTRDGKYYVSGDLTIEPGVTLTINPGVVIEIAPDNNHTTPDLDRVQIIVKGTLIVSGAGLNPVTFKSFVDPVQGSSDWLGIKFEPGSSGTLSNLVIKNASRAIENYSQLSISNCTVVDCDAAISAHADITATGLLISNTSASNAAVSVVGGVGSFSSCTFNGTPRAIENTVPITIAGGNFTNCGSVLVSNGSINASGSSFVANTGNPAIVLNSGTSTFTSCIFLNNANAIENFAPVTLTNCSFRSGGLAITARAALTSIGSVFANNAAPLTAIDVHSGAASLTNCTLASNTGSAIAVRGSGSAALIGCVTALNGGPAVRAMEGWTGSQTMQNSIVFDNGTSAGSWTDGQWQSNGQAVFNEHPAFCNAEGADYRLYAFSPAAAGPHFNERAGAFDIGCAPAATIITNPTTFLQACPQGDNGNLVISVNLDDAVMTRDVSANELRLDIHDMSAKVFEDDGIVSATGPATMANGYTTSIEHEAFGYYFEGMADVLLNGYPLATRAGTHIRTADCQVTFGIVNLTDAALFNAHHPSPPDPYNAACDFDDDQDSDLQDFAFFGAHYNHSASSAPANVPSEPVRSDAHVTLQFTEEFPTAMTHLLYVDIGVEGFGDVSASAFCFKLDNPGLNFSEWRPTETTLGDVLFSPVVRDGVPQLFFVTVVSDNFNGNSAHLGRLVFDVADLAPLGNVAEDFIQTISDAMLQSADTTVAVTAQMGGAVATAVGEERARVYHDRLEQNYPNPFNPSTTLAFSLRKSTNVSVTIFDVAGRRVRELLNERRERGAYKIVWDGRNDLGEAVSSGVYFYKLRAGAFTDTKKMTILK